LFILLVLLTAYSSLIIIIHVIYRPRLIKVHYTITLTYFIRRQLWQSYCFIPLKRRRREVGLLTTTIWILWSQSVITNVIFGLYLLVVGGTDGSTFVATKVTVEWIGVRIWCTLRILCWRLVISILLVFQKVRNLVPLIQLLQLIVV